MGLVIPSCLLNGFRHAWVDIITSFEAMKAQKAGFVV